MHSIPRWESKQKILTFLDCLLDSNQIENKTTFGFSPLNNDYRALNRFLISVVVTQGDPELIHHNQTKKVRCGQSFFVVSEKISRNTDNIDIR